MTNNNSNGKEKNKILIMSCICFAVIVVGLFIFLGYKMYNKDAEEKELAYTNLITAINNEEIEKIKMTAGSNSITVTYKGQGEEKDRQKTVLVPSLQAFIELIQEKVDKDGIKVELIQDPVNPLLRITDTVFSMLPTILLVVLMLMIFKMQGFGGDNGKVYGGEENKKTGVKFEDVAGLDEEKGELIEIVDFLKKPKAYQEMGAENLVLEKL